MAIPPFTSRELEDVGLTRHHLASAVDAGEIERPFRGVYIPSGESGDVRARAAALARVLPPGAAIARTAAAWLHGFDVRTPGAHDKPPPLEVVVPAGTTPPRRPGVVAYAARLPPEDVANIGGVPVTTIERTALDVSRYCPPFMALAGLDAMARAGVVQPDILLKRIEEWRGERNVASARRLILLCDPRSESAGESWTRLRVADAGFPTPDLQIWVPSDTERVYRLDMGWRKRRIGIEYDGLEFHGSSEQFLHDVRRRERLAREFGWQVIGVHRGHVLGRSLDFERGVGELLGMTPSITRRRW